MAYTVKQLANMSKVSVRTLHFYDEIDLLKPDSVGDNGYRYYEEEQLLLLQQILFFRELGFELKEIKSVLSREDFDKVAALKTHREVLLQNKKRISALVQTIDKTINKLEGEITMNDQELYHGFAPEKQAEYEKYLIDTNRVTTAQLADGKEQSKQWSKKDWKALKNKGDEINQKIVDAIKQNLAPSSVQVQKLTQRHFNLIQRFWEPTIEASPERYAALGELYLEHPDFKKMLDGYHPKLAEFLADAMKIFASKMIS